MQEVSTVYCQWRWAHKTTKQKWSKIRTNQCRQEKKRSELTYTNKPKSTGRREKKEEERQTQYYHRHSQELPHVHTNTQKKKNILISTSQYGCKGSITWYNAIHNTYIFRGYRTERQGTRDHSGGRHGTDTIERQMYKSSPWRCNRMRTFGLTCLTTHQTLRHSPRRRGSHPLTVLARSTSTSTLRLSIFLPSACL